MALMIKSTLEDSLRSPLDCLMVAVVLENHNQDALRKLLDYVEENGISWIANLSVDGLSDVPIFYYDCVVTWSHPSWGYSKELRYRMRASTGMAMLVEGLPIDASPPVVDRIRKVEQT